jgi:radical SAM modification target selenobiotic family peptide
MLIIFNLHISTMCCIFFFSGGNQMNKDKIRKALAGMGIAGLITGVSLMSITGCQSKEKVEEDPATKTEAVEADSAKGSCGQGSCGQGSCGQKAAEKDTTAKSSCSK